MSGEGGATPVDDRAATVALSALPGIGPRRLRALLGRDAAGRVWADLAHGRLTVDQPFEAACGHGAVAVVDRASTAARAIDPGALWARHVEADITVLLPGDLDWPDALTGDPDPPAVLFVRGNPAVLARSPAVAVVGTRRCSRYGWDTACRFGGELAAAGVAVVSGLASGIDGAAHRGALDLGGAPPIGVVATGLDVVYPRGHRRLWDEVADAGALVSESPLGIAPARWRFPARNRIIAALGAAVVVVESAPTGGAMHTVEEALRRDRPVLAVPGPVTSRASAGAHRLLADGAAPAFDVDEILLAIGAPPRARRSTAPEAARRPAGEPGRVLDALGWQPATLDQLVLRTGLSIGAVARAAAELEVDGWLGTDGGWFERRR